MEYTIARDYYVQEFDIQLPAGGVVYDGELEPDLVAQLVSQRVLVPEGQAVIDADEQPVEEEADEQPVDATPVEEESSEEPSSRRRNRRSES